MSFLRQLWDAYHRQVVTDDQRRRLEEQIAALQDRQNRGEEVSAEIAELEESLELLRLPPPGPKPDG